MLEKLAHFLLPRQSNNHRAKLIHSSTLVAISFLFILTQVALHVVETKTGKVLGYAANISATEVERLTNIERSNNGLPSLTDNPVLDKAALAKGQDMLAKGYWAHVAPDGKEPWTFFVSAGYEYKYAGENLARDFPDATSAVNAWMASPTHKENLLSPNYKEIGIGIVEGKLSGVDTTIIVQFFGTKLADSIPLQPVAKAAESTPSPSALPSIVPVSIANIKTPEPVRAEPLIASKQISAFDITRYFSFALVGSLIVIVAIDGYIINKRKIFRIAGHFPAHVAFLGMILLIVIIAKVGRII